MRVPIGESSFAFYSSKCVITLINNFQRALADFVDSCGDKWEIVGA